MKTLEIDTIQKYNDLFGFPTRHPLVSVVHFDKSVPIETGRMNFGFYALFLKKTKGCIINYGKTRYDYDDQTVVCFAPGQSTQIEVIEGVDNPEAIGLLFHPDLLFRTPLAQKMRDYSYFAYASNEALHLSEDERIVIEDYLTQIARELHHPIDKFSKQLIVSNIEVILNYCLRFYERQFITREKMNSDVLARFEALVDDYLLNGLAESRGIPSVKYFADKICLSPNYFGDLVKNETGKSALEYIQLKMLAKAKNDLLNPSLNTKQISASLGFQYPQHFIRFFKRQTGMTPREFQLSFNGN